MFIKRPYIFKKIIFKNVFPKNNSDRDMNFKLLQGIMVIKLQYKF